MGWRCLDVRLESFLKELGISINPPQVRIRKSLQNLLFVVELCALTCAMCMLKSWHIYAAF